MFCPSERNNLTHFQNQRYISIVMSHTHTDTYTHTAAYIQVLYKGGRVHPNWLDGQQGCRKVSTGLPLSSGLGWEEKRSEVQPL